MYDYLIVGSGLFGSTIAYRLKEKGKKVLVIEKRDHRDLCDNAKDYEGDVPSIDRPVKKVSIYKPINN